MSARLLTAAGFLMLALGAGGCGGSSSHPAASTASGSSSSTAAAVSSATTATTRRPPTRSRPVPAQTTTTTVATTPPPAPAGTPTPPAGLRAAAGYESYDLCASGCSGSVPASLRRPLHLPSVSGSNCPTFAAGGPVTPVSGLQLTVSPFVGSDWSGARVQWTASAGYTGPVLVRGRALGGAGAVGFGEGHVPVDELQLLASGMSAPPAPAGGRSWLTFTRVRTPGCYAYQIDGTSFSSVIEFRAH